MKKKSSRMPSALAVASLLALTGCASGSFGSGNAEKEWATGHAEEAAGRTQNAVSHYLSAASQGLSIAQYDAGRLLVRLSDSPSSQREGLKYLEQCANPESAGFYFVQRDSEAAQFAALAELGSLFESGRVVPRDTLVAGFLYRRAAEEARSLENWFSGNEGNQNVAAVLAVRNSSATGLSRMEKLGYAGEEYDWTSIRSMLGSSFSPPKPKSGFRYKIASSSFDPSDETTIFEFEILEGDYTLENDRILVGEMCRKAKSEFCDRHPEMSPEDIHVAPKDSSVLGSRVSYVVAAFWLKPSELAYSDRTKEGTLIIRTDGRNLGDAIKWACENLEPLVASQNVVLTVGKRPPPGAQYKVNDTELVDNGTRLKVSFTTKN